MGETPIVFSAVVPLTKVALIGEASAGATEKAWRKLWRSAATGGCSPGSAVGGTPTMVLISPDNAVGGTASTAATGTVNTSEPTTKVAALSVFGAASAAVMEKA